MENLNDKAVWTVKEFARHYEISLPTAYALTERPGFPLICVGRKKLVRVNKLEQWFDEVSTNGRSTF